LSLSGRRQDGVHLRGRVGLQGGHQVRVRVHREADLGVPERLHDRAAGNPLGQEQRRSGMPEIVKPDRRKHRPIRSAKDAAEDPGDVTRLQRRADGCGED